MATSARRQTASVHYILWPDVWSKNLDNNQYGFHKEFTKLKIEEYHAGGGRLIDQRLKHTLLTSTSCMAHLNRLCQIKIKCSSLTSGTTPPTTQPLGLHHMRPYMDKSLHTICLI
ncbi:hypothetical protein EPI10_021082 [Gossypium australe]|uniref:Uncharacterized protein n=1 Tax=Gossypium australe TaxID=47621 RepID=A0A5B6WHV1_9ROSI|nr:hypothetical protein EPI10_021082 [Gossypium australe]